MSQLTLDKLQSSLINHEHRISRSNTSLEGAFAAQPSIRCGRGIEGYSYRGRGISFSRGGCNNSPTNVVGREKNQNPI